MIRRTMTIADADLFSLDADYWIEYDYSVDNGVSIQEGVYIDIDVIYLSMGDKNYPITIDTDIMKAIEQQILRYDEDNEKNIL